MPASELRLPRTSRATPTHTSLATRRVPVAIYVVALLLLPAMVVTGSKLAGWWSTTGNRAGSLTAAGPATTRPGAAGEGGRVSPLVDPADVRGSMTVRQVAEAFAPVTAAEILAAFGAPAGTSEDVQLKSLVEGGSAMELPAFRTWLQARRADR